MHHAHYVNNSLHIEKIALQQLAAQYDTPLYVYSETALADNFRRIDQAFAGHPHTICYALKANSNPEILRKLAAMGCGADVVSVGEMRLALQAGIPRENIVFAGVGKRDDEIVAALEAGIRGLNVESIMELAVIGAIAAKMGKRAPVALRVNPDIDIHGHPYISTGRHGDKFGIVKEEIVPLLEKLRGDQRYEIVGLHAHLGSQIKEIEPYRKLSGVMRGLVLEARKREHPLRYLDLGGGLGIQYEQALPPVANAAGSDGFALDPAQIAAVLLSSLADLGLPVVFEPGRALVANAGLLLTRVLYRKATGGKKFVVVDAGMTELIRPSLYNAYHAIVPVALRAGDPEVADVVGPICESGDFLARDRELPPVERGDLLAVMTAGAYGFTLSSNYNARPRPAEVLVSGDQAHVIRPRQALESLWM